jgi:hypothetical protein
MFCTPGLRYPAENSAVVDVVVVDSLACRFHVLPTHTLIDWKSWLMR